MSETGAELPGLDPKLYYSIREVAGYTGVKAHVLRYWEQEFPTLRPKKNRAGNRSYRPRDIEEIVKIRKLLYEDGFKIDGARSCFGGPRTKSSRFHCSSTPLIWSRGGPRWPS